VSVSISCGVLEVPSGFSSETTARLKKKNQNLLKRFYCSYQNTDPSLSLIFNFLFGFSYELEPSPSRNAIMGIRGYIKKLTCILRPSG
jgi:hypothetical protein